VSGVSELLDFLFKNVPPVAGGRASAPAAAQWVREHGGPNYSAGHLRNVRNGSTRSPSYELLAWLSRYFGVPNEIWTDPDVERAVRADVIELHHFTAGLRADLTQQVAAMSSSQLERLRAHLEATLEQDGK